MAPFLVTLLAGRDPSSTTPGEFKYQWLRPGDVFSVLLILGGDVIARALSQLAGGVFTPVTFSFGMARPV